MLSSKSSESKLVFRDTAGEMPFSLIHCIAASSMQLYSLQLN